MYSRFTRPRQQISLCTDHWEHRTDSPFVNLNSGDSKTTRTFSAQMYLMWSSGLTNSIPVPVGSLSWSFFADAVQNMSTQQWTVQSDSSQSATHFKRGIHIHRGRAFIQMAAPRHVIELYKEAICRQRLFLLSSRCAFGRRDASGSKTTGAIFYCDQSAATVDCSRHRS